MHEQNFMIFGTYNYIMQKMRWC